MISLLSAVLCLTLSSANGEDALARSNKLLRKQHETLMKALHAITEEQSVGLYVSADCTSHINEPDCLVHGCQWDGYCQMPSSEKEVGGWGPDGLYDAHQSDNNYGRSSRTKANEKEVGGWGPDGLYDAHQSDHNYGRSYRTKAIEKQVGFGPPRCEIVCKYGGSSACDCSKYVQKESESETALGASYDSKYNCHSTALSCSWTPQKCPSGTKDVGYEEDLCRMGMFKTICCGEKAVGAEECDDDCDLWPEWKETIVDNYSQEEICGMDKSEKCRTCEDVQNYCGWKRVNLAEDYTYSLTPGGKCRTFDGEDPKHLYKGGKGSECKQICDDMNDCFGYSISEYDNCLLWLQRDIVGGGDAWGDEDCGCYIKDLSCNGNIDESYNCFSCWNYFSEKYLWGSTCKAKNYGADTYTKGVCGHQYRCIAGEDIGECPYGPRHCPSV